MEEGKEGGLKINASWRRKESHTAEHRAGEIRRKLRKERKEGG